MSVLTSNIHPVNNFDIDLSRYGKWPSRLLDLIQSAPDWHWTGSATRLWREALAGTGRIGRHSFHAAWKVLQRVGAVRWMSGAWRVGPAPHEPLALPEAGSSPSPREPDVRWVYFAAVEATGLVRIGVADDPAQMVRSMDEVSPDPVTLLDSMPGGEDLARDLKRRFSVFHKRGEWFSLAPIKDWLFPAARPANVRLRYKKSGPDHHQSVRSAPSIGPVQSDPVRSPPKGNARAHAPARANNQDHLRTQDRSPVEHPTPHPEERRMGTDRSPDEPLADGDSEPKVQEKIPTAAAPASKEPMSLLDRLWKGPPRDPVAEAEWEALHARGEASRGKIEEADLRPEFARAWCRHQPLPDPNDPIPVWNPPSLVPKIGPKEFEPLLVERMQELKKLIRRNWGEKALYAFTLQGSAFSLLCDQSNRTPPEVWTPTIDKLFVPGETPRSIGTYLAKMLSNAMDEHMKKYQELEVRPPPNWLRDSLLGYHEKTTDPLAAYVKKCNLMAAHEDRDK